MHLTCLYKVLFHSTFLSFKKEAWSNGLDLSTLSYVYRSPSKENDIPITTNVCLFVVRFFCRKYQVQEHTTKPTNHQCQPLYLKWAEIMDSFSQVLSIYNERVKSKMEQSIIVLNIKHLVGKKSRAASVGGNGDCSTTLIAYSQWQVIRERSWSELLLHNSVCIEPHEVLQDHMCKLRVQFFQLIPFNHLFWICKFVI